MPLVSVILPTYHHCKTLRYAIESIKNQTFADWELIIIDDGSTDGTHKLLEKYEKDPRIRVFTNLKNSGCPAQVCNQAVINHATGQYVAFQFDDDVWFDWCLEELTQGIGVADMAYGQSIYIDFPKKQFIELLGTTKIDRINILTGNKLANNAVLIKRDVFVKLGGFDESPVLRRVCDWELWIRLLYADYHVVQIQKVVSTCYLFNPGSVSTLFEYDVPAALKYIGDKLGVEFSR